MTHPQVRAGSVILYTEHAEEAAFIGNNGTVEDSRNTFGRITFNNRVVIMSPHRIVISCRSVLPGNVRQMIANQLYFFHS
ncbi:hypothetical protein D3C75_669570 [compost metagenome]